MPSALVQVTWMTAAPVLAWAFGVSAIVLAPTVPENVLAAIAFDVEGVCFLIFLQRLPTSF